MASAAAAGGAGAGAGAGSGSKVVLWSKNGESGFEVEEDVAKLSGYVKELLEVANEDDSDNEGTLLMSCGVCKTCVCVCAVSVAVCACVLFCGLNVTPGAVPF